MSHHGGRGKEGQRQGRRKESKAGSRGKGQDSFLLSETETKSPGRSQREQQICSKRLRLQSGTERAQPSYLTGQRLPSCNLGVT